MIRSFFLFFTGLAIKMLTSIAQNLQLVFLLFLHFTFILHQQNQSTVVLKTGFHTFQHLPIVPPRQTLELKANDIRNFAVVLT